MFRKLLSAVTSTAVVAGLATAGVVATASPAAAVATNPNLAGCGIPITLVMDASGSISGSEVTNMRNASKALLNGLVDTGSSARIIQFARTSEQIATRTNITSGANLNALNNAIDNTYKNGDVGNTTNWEAALYRATVGDANGLPPSGPDKGLVVFLTDGDPNTVGITDNTSSATDTAATNAAEVYANQLKNAGNRMLGVGIGMSTTGQQNRLKQVTGPTLVTSIPTNATINDFDVVVTSNFSDLEDALKRVAASLCGGSITVTKKTDDATKDTYVGANGWDFSATVTSGTNPADFVWLQPNPNQAGNTATGTTATLPGNPPKDGTITFQYTPKNTTVRTVRITETLKPGYTPRTAPNGYRCEFNGLNPPGPQTGTVTVNGDSAYFDITLKSDESASCEVFNTRDRGSLKITKIFDPKTSGFTGDFTIGYDCVGTTKDGSVQLAAGESTTITNVPTGDCVLSENALPNAPNGWTFGSPSFDPANGIVAVTKNATAEGTVTNTITRDTGNLKITKIFDKPSGLTLPNGFKFKIDYTCQNGVNGTVELDGSPAGQSETVNVPTGNCTINEQALPAIAGWTWGTPSYNPANKTVAVTKNATAEGKVTNTITRDTGSLKITKIFDPKTSGFTGDFTIGYDCVGTSKDGTVQLAAGESQTISDVPTGDCKITEDTLPAAPAGWTFGTPSFDPANGIVAVTKNATAEGKVTNTITRDTGSLKITKIFDPKTSGFTGDFTIGYDCVGTSKDGTVQLAAGESQTISDVPTGDCKITEDTLPAAPAGWTFGTPSFDPANGIVAVTKNATAEGKVTNTITRDTGSLKITKIFDPKTSGFTGDFTIGYDCVGTSKDGTVQLAAGESQTISDVPTGDCKITEDTLPAAPAGWTFGTPSFDPANGIVAVTKNATAEGKVTNTITRDTGSLKITKIFDPKTSGFTGDFTIGYDCVGTSKDGTVQLAAGESQTISDVPTGDCKITEDTLPAAPAGWTFGTPSFDPANGIVAVTKNATAEGKVTNTITRDTGSLKITKIFDPKTSGFTGDFTIGYDCVGTSKDGTVQLAAGESQTISDVPTGDCKITEDTLPAAPAGWTFGTPSFDPANGIVAVTKNATAEGKVTNTITRDTAELKLVKKVTGDNGDKKPGDWDLTAIAAAPDNGKNFTVKGDADTFQSVYASPTVYTLSETGPGNYTASTWKCEDADKNPVSATDGKVTVPNGKKVTCEITNDRDLAELAVVKKVDGGASAPADWKLSAKAAAPLNNKNIVDRAGNITVLEKVYAGTEYTLSETGPANYTQDGDWVCKTSTGVVVPSAGDKVSLAKGSKVTCEVTNTRDAAELKLLKKVTGDNGDKAAGDWDLSADAAAPNDGKNFTVKGDADTFNSVFAGTEYTLSEDGPGNYTASDWKCEDADKKPVDVTGGNKVTVKKNAKVTCEITNDRNTGELKLKKVVTGGDQQPDAWTLSAAAAAPLNDKNFSNLGGQGTFNSVYSAVEYTLNETGPGDYSPSDWKCTDADDNPVSSTGGKVTVAKNQKVLCEITNDRDLAELKLVKKVKGDNGDKAPGDWDLSADAAAPLDDKNFTVKGDADTFKTVYSGINYDLSETGPGNYTASDWKCENADGPIDVTDGTKVKVKKGDKVTCEITNDRNTAELKLVKDVKGGASKADDWTLTAKAEPKLDDKNISTPGGSGTFETVYSGTDYTLAETGPGNYTALGWECVGQNDNAKSFVQNGDVVNLSKNEKVTCTIINERDLAELKLVKQVEGKNNPDDWTLTAKAEAPDDDKNISTPGGSGTFENVYAGTEYTLAESGPGGYTAGEWVCLPANDVPDQVTAANLQDALNNGDKITLEKGAKVECTIVNIRDLGSLKITKSFDPKTSGYDKAFNIDYKCQDEAQGTVSLKAGQSETINGIPTGTECQVTEVKPTDPPAGWSFSDPVYDPASGKVTVAEKGQTVSVTVTNEILKPGINIVKAGSSTQVNPGETVTYTYTVTNTGDTTLNDVTVSDDKCAPVTYQSGDTNGDSKLQTNETWTYTCSQPISVATTNVATATGTDKNGLKVTAQDTFTVAVVSPVVNKKICPITVTLVKPKPKKVGNRVLVKKIKTKKSSCKILKPVVLCRPLASTAAGEKAFCNTKVTKRGKIRVKTRGYDKVKVTVIVRSKPKKGFEDRYKPNTWRKSWILR